MPDSFIESFKITRIKDSNGAVQDLLRWEMSEKTKH